MNELTEKQTEQMEAAWLPVAGKLKLSVTNSNYKLLGRAFKAGYTAAVNRECVWEWAENAVAFLSCYESECGIATIENLPNFCPNCGGKIVEGNDEKTV